MSPTLLPLPIVLPLAAALVSYLAGRRAPRTILVLYAAALVPAVTALGRAVWLRGTLRAGVGDWSAPVGIELRADGLSVAILGLTTVVFLAASVFAVGDFRASHDEAARDGGAQAAHDPCGRPSRVDALFWPLWYALAAALNALFLTADAFNLYVTLELVGLSGVGLVGLAGRPAFAAAMRYLLVSLLASLTYLLGIALFYGQTGSLDLSLLGQRLSPGPAAWVAAACVTAAMMAKSAVVPLHTWLPPAHASAPAPVSAVLSGLVIKAPFYVLLRMWFEVFPALTTPVLAESLGAVGGLAILWGSWLALRQRRLKLVVAYSTVAQIGYLFLVFPLATGAPSSTAGLAVVMHMLSHGCAKAAMFLAVGSIMAILGTDDLQAARGLASRLPRPALAFAIGGLALTGLPPGGGFVAKWLYVEGAILSGQWWWVVVIGAGTLLAGAYHFRILGVFLAVPADPGDARQPGAAMSWAPMALAVLALALGLLSAVPAGLLERALPAGLPALGGSL